MKGNENSDETEIIPLTHGQRKAEVRERGGSAVSKTTGMSRKEGRKLPFGCRENEESWSLSSEYLL